MQAIASTARFASAPSPMSAEADRNDSVDLLRGVAILGVLAVHCIGALPTSVPTVNYFLGLGRYGVQLFFVASAFTMLMMWERRARTEVRPVSAFYVRRVARIIPMFWIAAIFYLLIDGVGQRYFAPTGIGALEIALTFLTLHGWWPSAFNAVVPGGWSIAVEMTFYVIFPWLATRIHSLEAILVAICASSAIAWSAQAVSSGFLLSAPSSWSAELIDVYFKFLFLRQAAFFFIGMGVYRWVVRGERLRFDLKTITLCVTAALLAYAALGRGDFLVAGALAFFAALVLKRNFRVKVIGVLGRYSYSIYLVHFMVLRGVTVSIETLAINQDLRVLMGLVAVLAGSWTLAILTKRYVEDPGIAVGRVLLSRRARGLGALS
jgi:exopolysaccharide production protein ExoZ